MQNRWLPASFARAAVSSCAVSATAAGAAAGARGMPGIQVNQEAPIEAQWFGAARAGQLDLLSRLLQQHNNINLTDSAGRTALFYAATAGSKTSVDWLLSKDIDVRHRDNFGLTAVQTALERKHADLVQTLLKAGADKDQILANGDNLLHYAIRLQQYELVAPLTRLGVSVNHSNKEGWTPLDLAEYQGAAQTVAALEKLGARHGNGWRAERKAQDVKVVAQQLDDGSLPAAAKAVINDNRALLEQLLRNEPNAVNTVLDDGSTLLILAIKHQKPQMLSTLLKHRAEVNQIAYRGVTALHVAVQTNQEEMVKTLLTAGANARIGNVKIDIRGVRAQATLIVRLDNVRAIIERTLQTLDNNPQLVSQLLSTVDNTVNTVGGVANNAVGSAGATGRGEALRAALPPGSEE